MPASPRKEGHDGSCKLILSEAAREKMHGAAMVGEKAWCRTYCFSLVHKQWMACSGCPSKISSQVKEGEELERTITEQFEAAGERWMESYHKINISWSTDRRW